MGTFILLTALPLSGQSLSSLRDLQRMMKTLKFCLSFFAATARSVLPSALTNPLAASGTCPSLLCLQKWECFLIFRPAAIIGIICRYVGEWEVTA